MNESNLASLPNWSGRPKALVASSWPSRRSVRKLHFLCHLWSIGCWFLGLSQLHPHHPLVSMAPGTWFLSVPFNGPSISGHSLSTGVALDLHLVQLSGVFLNISFSSQNRSYPGSHFSYPGCIFLTSCWKISNQLALRNFTFDLCTTKFILFLTNPDMFPFLFDLL